MSSGQMQPGTSLASVIWIDPLNLPHVWPVVEVIMAHNPRGLMEYVDPRDVYDQIKTSKSFLFVGVDEGMIEMVLLCAPEKHAKRSILHIMWVGGAGVLKYLRAGRSSFEQWAALNGYQEIQIHGRPGWLKRLARHGYGAPGVWLRKDLTVMWAT